MLRLVVILSLVFQPLWLGAMHYCANGAGDESTVAIRSCCAVSQLSDDVVPHRFHCAGNGACCTGAVVCACGERDAQDPATPPSRGFGNGADHLLALLRLPTSRAVESHDDSRSLVRFERRDEDILLPAAASPNAFFCVWLT